MKLAKYKACICEGAAESAIIDILVDNDLLIFTREEMLEEQDLTQKEKMEKQLRLRRGMDDGDAANVAGKLMGILAKSQEMMQGESAENENGDDLSVSIEVVRE